MAAFSPDGARIVTASDDRTARIWDTATGKQIGSSLAGHGDKVVSAEFSPNGTRVVTASDDSKVRVWDAATRKPIGEPIKAEENGRAAFTPDGKRIFAVSGNQVRLWDAETGRLVGDALKGDGGHVRSAAFNPNGTQILTVSNGMLVRVWDAVTGELTTAPMEAGGPSRMGFVGDATFSPDGKRVITGSMDRGVLLWDAATGQLVGNPLKGDKTLVERAEFSRNGKRIMTLSNSNSASVWDASTGLQIGTPIQGGMAAISPDGARIVTTSDEIAQIWEIFADAQSLVSHVQALVPRCLTREQREAVFLPPEPPGWCVEMGKWPYNSRTWKQWLADVRAGKNPPLPAGPR
jgi:WD40 repeat protein